MISHEEAERLVTGERIERAEFVGPLDDVEGYVILTLSNGVRLWASAPMVYGEGDALASRRAPEPTPEHGRVEDCDLVYDGHVAAPGYGVAYHCSGCGRPWLAIGAAFVDPRERVYELAPEDVI